MMVPKIGSGVISLDKILWLQWIAGMGAMLMMFTLGLMVGWTSPYTAQLTADDSPLPITKDEASWVASLFNLGRLLGAPIGYISVQYLGSKRTMIVIGFPIIVSWICIIFADSVIWLYVARIVGGTSLGISFSSFPIYLGEVSSPVIRGALVSLTLTGVPFGTMIGNVMGSLLKMSVFSYISLIPTIAFILLFTWLPESPHFLVRSGRIDEAETSVARYDPYVDSKVEVESIRDFNEASGALKFKDRLREFNLTRNRRAGMICLALYFVMQFSGINSVIFYAEMVFTSARFDAIDPATAVMIVGAVGVLSGWISVSVADKFSRKTLMIVSNAGVFVSMLALGVHFALLDNGFDPNELQWLPITSIIGFQLLINVGTVTVPSMILSELFSPNIKNLAACIASISAGFFGFVAAKSYQPMIDVLREAYVFWIHAILMILSIVFSIFFLPETKGKTLQEIQDQLNA